MCCDPAGSLNKTGLEMLAATRHAGYKWPGSGRKTGAAEPRPGCFLPLGPGRSPPAFFRSEILINNLAVWS